MPRLYKPKTALNRLQFSPTVNPLLNPDDIQIKRRKIRSGHERQLVDTGTGEVSHISQIVTIEEKDDAEFVKVFAAGVKAIYQLSHTGGRVFQIVLDVYQNTAMHGGFAETVELYWYEGKLSGVEADMSEFTYNQGLRELIDKRFLAPRLVGSFWVNPTMFFKGDRVRFVKEYVRVQNGGTRSRRGRPSAKPKAVASENVAVSLELVPSVAPRLELVHTERERDVVDAA
ncbi:replication/maintenance protein RepL [Paraburkholderia jirisanensis]